MRTPASSITLRSATLQAVVLPESGGALARLDWTGDGDALPVLRGYAQAAPTGAAGEGGGARPRPNQLACFPLVPWSNRMAGGFSFGGRRYAIAPNRESDPYPMHGEGWLLPWEVIEQSGSTAVLALERLAGPVFSYRATITYTLDDAGLAVTLEVRNTGDSALPFGLGLHPWMPRSAGVTLQANAGTVWMAGPDKLPLEALPTPSSWSFAVPSTLPEGLIDNVFEGWDGKAGIAWPESGLSLAIASDCRYCIVYAPPGQDFFCVEPVDHRINAHNGEGGPERHGLTVLAPGQALRRHVRFDVTRQSGTPPET